MKLNSRPPVVNTPIQHMTEMLHGLGMTPYQTGRVVSVTIQAAEADYALVGVEHYTTTASGILVVEYVQFRMYTDED